MTSEDIGNSEERTVYVFGAGASHDSDFELPLLSALLPASADDEPSLSLAWPFIERHFGGTKEPNVESILTFLDCELSPFCRGWHEGRHPAIDAQDDTPYAAVRRCLIDYLCRRVMHKAKDGRSYCTRHERVLRALNLKPSDTLISFNYDLVLDCTLYKFYNEDQEARKKGPSRANRYEHAMKTAVRLSPRDRWHGAEPFDPRKPGWYLKLHGSLGWRVCETEHCPDRYDIDNLAEPLRHNLGDIHKFQKEASQTKYCGACARPLTGVIIAPTLRKLFESYPKLATLWLVAAHQLAAADRLVVIGFSFAVADFYVDWLFRSALEVNRREGKLKKIIIASPEKEALKGRMEQLGCRELPQDAWCLYGSFSQLDEVLSKVAATF